MVWQSMRLLKRSEPHEEGQICRVRSGNADKDDAALGQIDMHNALDVITQY